MDKSQTECSCNHLTHFAVLMQLDTKSGPEYDAGNISEVGSKTTVAAAAWCIVIRSFSNNDGDALDNID